jgi:hypothetical protein
MVNNENDIMLIALVFEQSNSWAPFRRHINLYDCEKYDTT